MYTNVIQRIWRNDTTERFRHTREDTRKDLQATECEDMHWLQLAEAKDQSVASTYKHDNDLFGYIKDILD
jgi:hypothetical protein